jgi:ubiquinone/menaquinone biosynthesis C-methylase UbiE
VRALLVVLLVSLVTACGRNEAEGQPSGSGSNPADDMAREQAQFDRDRKPETIVEALGIHPGSRVADIGAGSGRLTIHLAKAVAPNGHVVATDVDSQVLDQLLRPRMQNAHLSDIVETRVVEADKPGLEDGMYDAILLSEVDHYFNELPGGPVPWFKLAIKALKPDGRLVISNRIHHRAQSIQSATKAGLVLKSESSPTPNYFIAVFGPPERGK